MTNASCRRPSRSSFRGPLGSGRRDGARGMALIVAMLVILVLSAVSLIALQATSNRLNLAGSARVATVARQVTFSGTEGTMSFAAMDPSGFNQYVLATSGVVAMTSVSPNFFDLALDGSGSFGREGVSVETVGWDSRMISALTTHRAPGYQLGEYCFRKYLSLTDGYYRNDPGSTTQQDLRRNIERNAQARALANLFVGPITCP